MSHTKGVRFVAINRRGYKGSTRFTDADKAVVTSGTNEEKADWLRARGSEIAHFVDGFIQREKLPPISPDGKRGGVALVGWSLGVLFTTAAIAHVAAFSPQVQERLSTHLLVHLMQGHFIIGHSPFSLINQLSTNRATLHCLWSPFPPSDIFA